MSARKWATENDFITAFKDYVAHCTENNRLVNVAGFCAFTECHRDTYYAQNEYYSDTFKKIDAILEDEALNADIAPAVKIFYLKNKCGYKDQQEIKQNVTVDRSPIDELVQSIEEIKNK